MLASTVTVLVHVSLVMIQFICHIVIVISLEVFKSLEGIGAELIRDEHILEMVELVVGTEDEGMVATEPSRCPQWSRCPGS